MKNLRYILLLLLFQGLGGLFGQAQTSINGFISNWDHGEAVIGYYDVFSIEMYPLGTINNDGSFSFSLEKDPIGRLVKKENGAQEFPEGWKMKYNTLENYFTGAGNVMEITNPQTLIFMLPDLYFQVTKNKSVSGVLLPVSSKGVADYLATWGEGNLKPKDYYLSWIFTNDTATVNGRFSISSFTGNEDEEIEITTFTDLKFEQGWNLLKTEFSEIFTTANGKAHPLKVHLTIIDPVPRDAQWFVILD